MGQSTYNGVVPGTLKTVSGRTSEEGLLAAELHTFEQHRAALLGAALHRFALVHGTELVGSYESESDAISEGYRRFGNVPFLVKRVEASDAPEHFASNVLAL